jgi:hypothetical protein
MKKLLPALALSFITFGTIAQTLPKSSFSAGFAYGRSDKINMGSIPVSCSHQIAGKPSFRYILGIRQNLAFGSTEFNINDQKTLIDDLSNYSVNLFAGLEYISKYKVLVGVNTDLLGGTFGTRSFKTIGKDPVYSVNPESINVCMSKGSVNSELYLGYRFNDNITVKAGLSHYLLSLEYSNSKEKGVTQTSVNIPFVKIEYTLWQQ